VFINNKLVIDLGGVHAKLSGSVKLDEVATQLGLVKGMTYPLDLFHAERHTTESNLQITTSIVFLPTASIQATQPIAHKAGTVPGEFTITLDRPAPAGGMVVTYGVNEGTPPQSLTSLPAPAVENTDFVLQPGGRSVTIPAGQTQVKLQVNPQGAPPLGVSTGMVFATLQTSPNYQLGAPTAIVMITDESFLNAQILAAGDANKVTPQNGAFKVSLDRPAPTGGLTVNYAIVPGATNGAIADVDFTALSGTVVVPAGLTEVLIPVVPKATQRVDASKPLTCKLQPGTNYQPGTTTATINLIDKAPPVVIPTVSIAAGGNARRPVPGQPASPGRPPKPAKPPIAPINSSFTLTCSPPPAQNIVVIFSLGGTAQRSLDYDMPGIAPSSVMIPAGQASVVMPVNPMVAAAFRNQPQGLTVVVTLQEIAGSYRLGNGLASLTIMPGPVTQP